MKISFMTFACPQWSFEQVLSVAEEYGYQGIEFRCDAEHQHGVEVGTSLHQRKRMARRLEAAGVEACCLATSLRLAGDSAVREAPARIELAADMGCPLVRVFAGPWGEGVSRDAALDRIASNLREVADAAARVEVKLLLETHDTMCLGADAGEAVRRAAHPAVAVNYDNMHPCRMGEPLEKTVEALAGLVAHCHFHDALNSREKVVITPIGQGQMPIDDMFAALVAMKYDGYLSGEWFNDQYGPDPHESLQRYRQDLVALAQRHGVKIG